MNPEPIDKPTYDDPMIPVLPKGTKTMLLQENLARERMREAEQVAREQRLVRRLNSVRRWERLSTWAARRAERARNLL